MKATLELLYPLFRRAKATAAERGQWLKEFVTEALEDKLQRSDRWANPGEGILIQGFGKLKRLHKETVMSRRPRGSSA